MTPTLASHLRHQADRLGPAPALRHRGGGLSWALLHAAATANASTLIDAGVRPGDAVGLWSANRPAWPVAAFGVWSAGAVLVPAHAGLPAGAVAAQWADAGVTWAFVATAEQRAALDERRDRLPKLRGVSLLDDTPYALADASPDERPGDLAAILYTSGTTGEPKGVTLTHANLLANATAVQAACPFVPGAVLLNVLPFSHVYALTSDLVQCLVAGATLALAESPATFARDLRDARPHHVHAVPRLYEKLLAEAGSDGLREATGGRAEWLMSGGAPLPRSVADAYHAAGLNLLEGYGLTEAGPVVTTAGRDGTVGRPLPGTDIRLSAEGELLVRGPAVTPGYWQRPDATAAAFRDGWLATGDLAELTPDGAVRIVGRLKELIVLSTGRKVHPTAVEGRLLADPAFDQAIVCGDGRPAIAALVVLRSEVVRRELGRDDPASVREWLAARAAAATAELAPWERVRRVAVLPGPLTAEAGELTVSLKPRRAAILARHAAAVAAAYSG
jgi:long-chain acyl-CoA synthetase